MVQYNPSVCPSAILQHISACSLLCCITILLCDPLPYYSTHLLCAFLPCYSTNLCAPLPYYNTFLRAPRYSAIQFFCMPLCHTTAQFSHTTAQILSAPCHATAQFVISAMLGTHHPLLLAVCCCQCQGHSAPCRFLSECSPLGQRRSWHWHPVWSWPPARQFNTSVERQHNW